MKSVVAYSIVAMMLIVTQVMTYSFLSTKMLAPKVIENLKVDIGLKSDSIVLNTVAGICGNVSDIPEYIFLNLNSRENLNLLENKLQGFKLLDADDYGKYCSEVAQDKYKQMKNDDWVEFVRSLKKPELNIVAYKNGYFIINVITSWDRTDENSSSEDSYIWIFFTWIKI